VNCRAKKTPCERDPFALLHLEHALIRFSGFMA
jgi:hypothetical protein